MKTINEGLVNILNEFDQFNRNKALSKTMIEYTGWQFGMTNDVANQAKDVQGKHKMNMDKLSKYSNKWSNFLNKRQNDSIVVDGKLDPDNKLERLSEMEKRKFYHETELSEAPDFRDVQKSMQKMEKVMPKYIKKSDKPVSELNEGFSDVIGAIGKTGNIAANVVGNVASTVPWVFNIVAISIMGWLLIKIIRFITGVLGFIASAIGLIAQNIVPVLVISLQTFALFRLIVFFVMLIKSKKDNKNIKRDLDNYKEQTQTYTDQVKKDKNAPAITKTKVQEYNNNIQKLSQEAV